MVRENRKSIRELRADVGLSIRDLSDRTGINRGRLSIIERGVIPSAEELRRILDVLDAAKGIARRACVSVQPNTGNRCTRQDPHGPEDVHRRGAATWGSRVPPQPRWLANIKAREMSGWNPL